MRFRTLGEKLNASAAEVSPDVDAQGLWHDDEIDFPEHMTAAARALANADDAIPPPRRTRQKPLKTRELTAQSLLGFS